MIWLSFAFPRTRGSIACGFSLPTILIVSVVMLIVLASSVAASGSIRESLNDQRYAQLAAEAAESGIARAHQCLRDNAYVVQWGVGASGKPLTSSTDCTGAILPTCGSGCYVMNEPLVKTTFSSARVVATGDGSLKVTVTGQLQLRRASSPTTVWKTIERTATRNDRYANQPQLGAGAGWMETGHIGYMVTRDGYLYGFGDNSNQQVSDSLRSPITTPVLMKLPPGVTQVKSLVTSGQGASIICIIGSDDQAYCRGKPGSPGEEGLMDYNVQGWQRFTIPGSVAKIKSIGLQGQGGDTACVITEYSRMYCAGENYMYDGLSGLLGSGDTVSRFKLISDAVKFEIPGNPGVKYGYNQDRVVCAITVTDVLYCSGNNVYGTLGNGGNTGSAVPIAYPLPGGRKPVDVVSSYHEQVNRILHVLASDGTIWGSGRNTYGELGVGTTAVQRSPVQFGNRNDYKSMIAGQRHLCGITNSGEVYCAGENTLGQLGTGTCVNSSVPVRFLLPAGEKARSVVIGSNQHQSEATMILTESGNIYSAGKDEYGRFGTGSPGSGPSFARCSPVKAVLPAGVTATSLSTNDAYSTYFMGSDGRPYGMGRNNQGQLGDGTMVNSPRPKSALIPRIGIIF